MVVFSGVVWVSDAPVCATQIISDDVIKAMTKYANMEKLKKTAVQVCLAGAHSRPALLRPHSDMSFVLAPWNPGGGLDIDAC